MANDTGFVHLYKIILINDDKDVLYLNPSTINNIAISDTNSNWSEIYTTIRPLPYVVDLQIDNLVNDLYIDYRNKLKRL
jgi:hypothetical protein